MILLVPRRRDFGQRDRVWKWLRTHWEDQGFTIYEGYHEVGPFNAAAALNAASRVGPWDVAVITNADLLVPTHQLHQAVEVARRTGSYTRAFDQYHYLSEQATDEVLNGSVPSVEMAEWSGPFGNVPAAITRELWEAVGGEDEGFVGWGYEDISFRLACERLAGETCVPGPLFHLWHPIAPDATTEGASLDNRARYLEYVEGVR